MSTGARKKPSTRAEFLAWEERRDERFEFVDGIATLMAGGTVAHNTIAMNIVSALHAALRGSSCRVFQHNRKLAPAVGEDIVYPDVAVVCGGVKDEATTVAEATVLVEVVSLSSRHRDSEKKWQSYREIEALRHYLLAEQAEARVMLFSRASASEAWQEREIAGLAAGVELPAVKAALRLRPIYEGTSRRGGGDAERRPDALRRLLRGGLAQVAGVSAKRQRSSRGAERSQPISNSATTRSCPSETERTRYWLVPPVSGSVRTISNLPEGVGPAERPKMRLTFWPALNLWVMGVSLPAALVQEALAACVHLQDAQGVAGAEPGEEGHDRDEDEG